MGDIADWMIDQAIGAREWRGGRSHSAYRGHVPSLPTCRRCGLTCTWHHTGERWALADNVGRLHDCTQVSADEFAVLPDFDPNDPAQGLG